MKFSRYAVEYGRARVCVGLSGRAWFILFTLGNCATQSKLHARTEEGYGELFFFLVLCNYTRSLSLTSEITLQLVYNDDLVEYVSLRSSTEFFSAHQSFEFEWMYTRTTTEPSCRKFR